MAYTYTRVLPTAQAQKAGLDAIDSLFEHLPVIYSQLAIDLVSITWDRATTTLTLTMSAKLPAVVENHLGIV